MLGVRTLEMELSEPCSDLLEDQIEGGTPGISGGCFRETGFDCQNSFLMVLCKKRMHFIIANFLSLGIFKQRSRAAKV